MKRLLVLVFALAQHFAQAQTIHTVAGNGTMPYSGDGLQATAAGLGLPRGIAHDRRGNLYITDSNTIRKKSPSGIITRFAGTGMTGFSGDGGPATAATFNCPTSIVCDDTGNLYIADRYNARVRKIDTFGTISTFAGGIPTWTGWSYGHRTNFHLGDPVGLAVDKHFLYLVDEEELVIWKMALAIDTIFVGHTHVGGSMARVCADTSGNLYYTDPLQPYVYKVDTAGNQIVISGTGSIGSGGDGGPATAASFFLPHGIIWDKQNNLYVSDAYWANTRKISLSTGIITNFAGTSTLGFSGDGGPATAADMWSQGTPELTMDTLGNLYINDAYNNRIRMVRSAVTLKLAQTAPPRIRIHPNPASDVIVVEEANEGLYAITDAFGHEMFSGNLKNGRTIRVSGFPRGVYILRVGQNTVTFLKE